MCNSNDGPDYHLNCAYQITHRSVILRTHGPKYRQMNDYSNCAIQIPHRDVILRTQSKFDIVIQMIMQIVQFELKFELRTFALV